MAIERRVTEIAGCRWRPTAHGRARATIRSPPTSRCSSAPTRSGPPSAITGWPRRWSSSPRSHLDWPMPGYTHLQRAQPVYLSHHLLAYVWMLLRDRDRFVDVTAATARLPLGAGALAGVNFDTDRSAVAAELGFSAVAENSIDAVSNRDFVLDYLSAAATCATHLSRLGAEIVLWSSEEFGFCELSDAWASGSSIMPQKKNPDAAELLRAKAPRIAGHLVALHGVMHGLPLTYNKDMQEDKEHLFDAVDTLELCLAAAQGMLGSISFRSRAAGGRERRRAARRDRYRRPAGAPGRAVPRGPRDRRRPCSGRRVRGQAVVGADAGTSSPPRPTGSTTSSTRCLSDGAWLESKVSEGGTSLARVREQVGRARAALAS